MRTSCAAAAAAVFAAYFAIAAAPADGAMFRVASILPFNGPPVAALSGLRAKAILDAAADDINADATLLAGHELRFEGFNTFFNIDAAYKHFRTVIYSAAEGDCNTNSSVEARYVGVGGTIESWVTQALSFSARLESMPLVTSFSLSPSFSDKSVYPNIVRTTLPVVSQNDLFLDLMRRYGWRRAVVVSTDDALGIDLTESLLGSDAADGITLRAFYFSQLDTVSIADAVARAAETEFRVVYVNAAPPTAFLIVDALEAAGMLRGDHVIVSTGLYCSLFVGRGVPLAARARLRGWMCLDSARPDTDRFAALAQRLHALSNTTWPTPAAVDIHDAETYDVALAWAHALQRTLDANASLGPDDVTPARVLVELSRPGFSFPGVSSTSASGGNTSFDANLDRVGQLRVSNVQEDGSFLTVDFDGDDDLPAGVLWPSGARGADVPADFPPPTRRERLRALEIGAMAVSLAFAAVIAVMLYAVHALRAHPIMRAGAVNLSYVSLLGCLLSEAGVAVVAALGESQAACIVQPAVAAVAFSLLFGCLVGKLLQLNSIFNNKRLKTATAGTMVASAWASVMALVGYNVCVLVAWFSADAPTLGLVDDPSHDRSVVFECSSSHGDVWTGLLVAPNAALVVVSCVLAFRTRNVSGHFSEARSVMVAVYNLALLGSLTVVLVATAGHAVDTKYALTAFSLSFIPLASAVAMLGSRLFRIVVLKDDGSSSAGRTGENMSKGAGRRIRSGSNNASFGVKMSPHTMRTPSRTLTVTPLPAGSGSGSGHRSLELPPLKSST